MKKAMLLVALVLAALLMAGCGSRATRTPDAVAQQYAEEVTGGQGEAAPQAAATQLPPAMAPGQNVDFDLQGLGYPVVYAQIYEMARDPHKHVGKTMRVEGMYQGASYEDYGVIHLVLVVDSAGCCEVALEFAVTGDLQWPEDFPPNNSQILLTGVLSTTTAGENTYPLLVVDHVEVLQAAAS